MVLKITLLLLFVVSFFINLTFTHSYKLETRIIQGINTLQDEFPFVVSLRYRKIHHCAGSIISQKHILTAAHCIINGTSDLSIYSVFVGNNKLTDAKEIKIDWIKVNKNYKGEYDWWKNDLAIIQLKDSLNFTQSIKSINIRQNELIKGNESVTAIGWGIFMQPSQFLPNIQQKLLAKYLSHEKCKNYWNSIDVNQICFWNGQNSGKGICSTDSGGPLIHENELVGVLSWTPSSCTKDKPDVAVKIAPYFLKWINKHVYENF